MKFVRFGEAGAERPGMLDSAGRIRDLSGVIDDLSGKVLGRLPELAALDGLPVVRGNPRLGPPVAGIGKLIGIGLNYSDHAAETGMDAPPEPVMFLKATSCICGPNDTVRLPKGAACTDWEVELGVVIGKAAKYVDEAAAPDHVAGYTIVNDVSERHFQIRRAGQWTKGKSPDTFGPIGPWLVTPDDAGDPQAMELTLDVNGTRMQTGNTSRMIFGVAHIIAYLSQIMTLHPGDVIATGTPPGVGMARKPEPIYLKDGDVMELVISGLGQQRQRIVAD